MSTLITTNLKHASSSTNNIVLHSDGSFRTSGGIIETFLSPCDGSTIALPSGNQTVSNVSAASDLTTTYADIPGSEITYTPPSDTKIVIYKFIFATSRDDAQSRAHYKFFVGGTEVTNARWGDGSGASAAVDRYHNFEWAINIGGTANSATGRQASWGSGLALKLQAREYLGSYESTVHQVYYWDGSNSDPQFHQPCIGITAIG
jgi:hypothetical protein